MCFNVKENMKFLELYIRKKFKPGSKLSIYLRGPILNFLQTVTDNLNHIYWLMEGCQIPASVKVKRKILSKFAHPMSTWVETGTYHGDTTNYLAKRFSKIISIEPAKELYVRAVDRFNKQKNIILLCNSSEEIFEEVCENISGNVAFWLDGHVSEIGTYRGINTTPLLIEIGIIEENLFRYKNVSIFIDDIRLMEKSFCAQDGYPSLEKLLSFVEKNKMIYLIQNDILIIKNIC
jgi:hypothetical protein